MMKMQLLVLVSVMLAPTMVHSLDPPSEKTTAKLPPCGACTNLVTSFEAGMERTKRGKLEGGDAAWEEKAGQRYATSEVHKYAYLDILFHINECLLGSVGRDHRAVVQGCWERRGSVSCQCW